MSERRAALTRIPEIRSLGPPLRRLAEMRRAAPLLYIELGGLPRPSRPDATNIRAICKRTVAASLRASIGSALRRHDAIAAGPGASWFVALLLGRAVAPGLRPKTPDADLGIAAARLRIAVQTALDELERARILPLHVSVRAGWTVVEPVDRERPLPGLLHAVRGAAVVARVEQRRAVVLAAVTHELRTPLTSISGYVERLRDGTALSKQKRLRYLSVVADEARRLNRLVDGLIDVGAWSAGNLKLHRQQVALAGLVRLAWRTVAERADRRKIRLRVKGAGAANIDRERMLQVLINLLDNAVRYARDGGVVEVQIRAGSGTCDLRVCDDGAGFDRNTLRSVGRPFAAGPGGRKGLGLAISQLLVEAHGGSLGVSGSPDTGGRVLIRWPE
ncbi:MAG: HAMP domain-containing histidine kinase [Candidatus Eremiobacteraeota bacterium]|nr:HAMP domain-containing histidine kinase [Candidatus Eremiobacteraeota bacterium]